MEIININELNKRGYYVANLDGEQCKDAESFLREIGKSFRFPHTEPNFS